MHVNPKNRILYNKMDFFISDLTTADGLMNFYETGSFPDTKFGENDV